jgi:hypothetical protein
VLIFFFPVIETNITQTAAETESAHKELLQAEEVIVIICFCFCLLLLI